MYDIQVYLVGMANLEALVLKCQLVSYLVSYYIAVCF